MNSTTFKNRVLPVLIGSMLSFSAIAAMPTFTDTNGDGVISADEITVIRDAHQAANMAKYDADGNGELSRTERRALKDARYDSMLQLNDTDGDGELSREERRSAQDAGRAAMDLQLDVNQDGDVSEAERAGFEAVKGDIKGNGKKHSWGKKHGKGERHGKGHGSQDDYAPTEENEEV
ncbi:MAG: hypothetical protein ACI9UN_001216 [Granulosicoccus sp.]|jgi:hypothetical protein